MSTKTEILRGTIPGTVADYIDSVLADLQRTAEVERAQSKARIDALTSALGGLATQIGELQSQLNRIRSDDKYALTRAKVNALLRSEGE